MSDTIKSGAPVGNKNAVGHKAVIHLNEMVWKPHRVNPEKASVISEGRIGNTEHHLVFDHEKKVVHHVLDEKSEAHGNRWDFETGDEGEYERLVKKHNVKSSEAEISSEVIRATGTSEGVKKSWEHRTRAGASAHLKSLRMDGYKGRAKIEHDERKGVFFVRKLEGELAPRKQAEEITPYDKDIRRMKKYGTQDLHGALADAIYDDNKARKEWEGDNAGVEGVTWEDAAGDLAHNYLQMFNAKVKATDQDLMNETITAAGNSEGAKKGWEKREHGSQGWQGREEHHLHHDGGYGHVMKKSSGKFSSVAVLNHGSGKMGSHETLNEAKEAVESHLNSAPAFNPTVEDKSKASDHNVHNTEVIHCRSHNGVALTASEDWVVGQPTQFMWMPAGLHTIVAGFRDGSIELCVQCDQATLDSVQASLSSWRANRPKQEPFGCIEHREQEASVRVGASCGFEWREDGVYLAAEPTKLGADNVNGRVHRSWSPSFTTDADYSKAVKSSGVLRFPDGVRGSASNPARITGVDFCVGTLTNKPAFHAMSPVKASEGEETVQATWSDAARKAAAEARHSHIEKMSDSAYRTSQDAHDDRSYLSHDLAAKVHEHMAEVSKEYPNPQMHAMHTDKAKEHREESKRIRKQVESRQAEHNAFKASEATPTPDTIQARHQSAVESANQIAANHGALRLSVEDVYEKCTVTATGTSDGAKKGWENRTAPHLADKNEVHSQLEDIGETFRSIQSKGGGGTLYKHPLMKRQAALHKRLDELSKINSSDATPDEILNKIYARAGANR